MKSIRQATYALFMTFMITSTYQCSSSKQFASQSTTPIPLQQKPTFKLNEVVFQEWYAGIKVGGTGFNIFLPNITNDENIVFENIYFRNLEGKINKGNGFYSAVLKNPSPYYTWEYPEKPKDYPFDLTANECVVSYIENSERKYIKINTLKEKAGAYYENGHPSIYGGKPVDAVATVEKD